MSKYLVYILLVFILTSVLWRQFVWLFFDYFWYFQFLYLLLFAGGTYALIFLSDVWKQKSPMLFMSFVGAKFFVTLLAIYAFRVELRSVEVALFMGEYMALSLGQTFFFYQLFQKK